MFLEKGLATPTVGVQKKESWLSAVKVLVSGARQPGKQRAVSGVVIARGKESIRIIAAFLSSGAPPRQKKAVLSETVAIRVVAKAPPESTLTGQEKEVAPAGMIKEAGSGA